MKVVTRFAPSPTGSGMHIGGARTALFNYLYARHHGGEFKIRIEDTDADRNNPQTVTALLDALNWLGLNHDGEIVRQSERSDRHREVVDMLLRSGLAYRCYLDPKETADLKIPGKAFRSPYRDPTSLPPVLASRLNDPSAPFCVRFKGSTDGEVVVRDLVRGDVRFDAANLDDLVLMRSDGTPTYNLAVVVDDYDMEISHVIRGDDHLNNAARQQLIYEALRWPVPAWAHIPLIHDDKGKKLSKRTGTAVSVEDFAKLGYCPDGMFNYLCRMGWGHGDDEIFTRAQAIEWFDVVDVVSSPARLDWNKLDYVNNHHLRSDALHVTVREVHSLLNAEFCDGDVLFRAAESLREGASTYVKLAEMVKPFITYTVERAAADILADPTAIALLKRVFESLEPEFFRSPDALNAAIKDFSSDNDIPMKKIGPVVRAALTGRKTAPDLGTCFYILGPVESDERVNKY